MDTTPNYPLTEAIKAAKVLTPYMSAKKFLIPGLEGVYVDRTGQMWYATDRYVIGEFRFNVAWDKPEEDGLFLPSTAVEYIAKINLAKLRHTNKEEYCLRIDVEGKAITVVVFHPELGHDSSKTFTQIDNPDSFPRTISKLLEVRPAEELTVMELNHERLAVLMSTSKLLGESLIIEPAGGKKNPIFFHAENFRGVAMQVDL